MHARLVQRILLGLLMLIPGLTKLFVFTPSGVTGMLSGFGFPAPTFFAWVLILAEIVFGLAIIANWKLQYTSWPPIIILVVAVIVGTSWSDPNITNLLFHLVAISGYWMLWEGARKHAAKK